jgi:DNA-binding helix-hairpin-helix protein with protein kinase domain
VLSTVTVDGQRFALRGLPPLGQGGEAEVFDLGDGRALKILKAPDHPDYAGLPAAQAAAAVRLAGLGDKLAAFPRRLPPRVVAPSALAIAGRRGPVVGYAMPRVTGDAIAVAADARWRRSAGVDGNAVVAALRDLAATLAAIHAAGAVVGDLNDQDVLVDWATARA